MEPFFLGSLTAKELSKARKDGSRAYGVGPYFLSKVLIEGEYVVQRELLIYVEVGGPELELREGGF